jgi:hypothetical protein
LIPVVKDPDGFFGVEHRRQQMPVFTVENSNQIRAKYKSLRAKLA